jgi:hypothetical protein
MYGINNKKESKLPVSQMRRPPLSIYPHIQVLHPLVTTSGISADGKLWLFLIRSTMELPPSFNSFPVKMAGSQSME